MRTLNARSLVSVVVMTLATAIQPSGGRASSVDAQIQRQVLYDGVSVTTRNLESLDYGLSHSAAQQPQSDLVDLIVFAGHGAVFDKDMKEIRLDNDLIAKIQDALIGRIAQTQAGKSDMTSVIKEAQEILRSKQLNEAEAIVVKGGMIGALLTDAPDLARYSQTNAIVLSNFLSRNPEVLTKLRPDILDLARRLGVLTNPDRPIVKQTFYMNLCRLAGVPIPPDWAEDGTPWVLQGELETKLILPEKAAMVWTYSDPTIRGACIALPRGTGGPGDQLGIICQGANSGAACFWDNRDSAGRMIPWRGRRLVISELQDGTNLSERCTRCHRGDNVFLMPPDDPTWAKVLRGPLNGPRTGTFTTHAYEPRSAPDPDLAYVPLTGLRDRPDWTIPRLTTGCAIGCHLDGGVFTDWALRNMPPACARVPGRPLDVSRCYGSR